MKRSPRRKGPGAIDLLEQAVAVLRHAPTAAIVSYYLGTLPFILGLLYFWTDMAKSPFAQKHLTEAALGMSALYVWMKAWQAAFASRLVAHLAGAPPPQFTRARILRMTAQQAAWQPFSLFGLPIATVIFLPFAWFFAFVHNLSATGNGEDPGFTEPFKKAWKLASLWGMQNHRLIVLYWLLWAVVYLNVASLFAFVPEVVRMLTGIESAFTMSASSLLNTTFFAVITGVTHLCMNPMIKTVYVLRCFYGESLHSGADLKAELNAVARESAGARVSILVLLLLTLGGAVGAVEKSEIATKVATTSPCFTRILYARACSSDFSRYLYSTAAGVSPADSNSPPQTKVEANANVSAKELNESIDRVISKREYQWRVPRNKQDVNEDRSALADFLQAIQDWALRITKPIREWWHRFVEWLRSLLNPGSSGDVPGLPAAPDVQMTLLLILLVVTSAILGILLWRARRRKREALEVAAQPVTVLPNLQDENLIASQLPEEEWQALAAELMMKGELRLAMRALYMASLAFLAGRGMITIARYKSNRDYQRELLRRAREKQPLLEAFADNVVLFERSWYGDHEVTEQLMNTFDLNHDRIRTFAQE